MRILVIVALAMVWLALAYSAFSRGDMVMAGVFVVAGVALTVYRLQKSPPQA